LPVYNPEINGRTVAGFPAGSLQGGHRMAGSGQDTVEAPPRTLVVCCDGTWNDPADQTNVWRTFELLRQHCDEPPVHPDPRTGSATFTSSLDVDLPDGRRMPVSICAFYDKGVGEARGGGAFGVGLGVNVRQAYDFVARNWVPGAHIFVFGFSRGAYTARSLAGMLNAVGLVDPERDGAGLAAWEHYRLPPAERTHERKQAIDALQKAGAARGTVVRFLGVWDTVGSLGVPVPQFRGLSNKLFGGIYRFHDTGLGANVLNACQALAIHEQRGAFKPVLWTRRHQCIRDELGEETRQRVLQVWFTGSHGDVGGGYHGDRRLADIALTWMLQRALECGHPLSEPAWLPHCEPSALGARNDSLNRSWRFAAGDRSALTDSLLAQLPVVGKLVLAVLDAVAVRNVPRAIGGEIPTDDGQFVVGLGERLHASVTERYRGDHAPASVKLAMAAGLPVFHERACERQPCAAGAAVVIDDDAAVLVDRSKNGIGVADVGWLQPDARCRVALDGERWGARVAWTSGDRAGLALMYKLRRANAEPARLA
jgi:uncharacterized protein (DUF2235 family)